jgi:CubicO group peptidase (beta-lactamase class C family)
VNVEEKAEQVAADIRLAWAVPAWEREPPLGLAPLLQRLRIPAVSIAVVRGGGLAWAHAWGVAAAGRPDPVTPRTLFQAGSISKPVAAMCALRLAAQGRLDLDADVNEVLVAWKVPANHGWQPRVSVRQLLSHTAGLTVHGFPGYPWTSPPQAWSRCSKAAATRRRCGWGPFLGCSSATPAAGTASCSSCWST